MDACHLKQVAWFTLPAGRSRKPTFPAKFVGKKPFQPSREPTNSAGNLLKRRFPAPAGSKCERP